jgi:hypothetical protein
MSMGAISVAPPPLGNLWVCAKIRYLSQQAFRLTQLVAQAG